jgi:hypothetical protein
MSHLSSSASGGIARHKLELNVRAVSIKDCIIDFLLITISPTIYSKNVTLINEV